MRGTNTVLVSSDERLREAVSLVAKTRRGTRRTWRVETSRHEYDKASRSRKAFVQTPIPKLCVEPGSPPERPFNSCRPAIFGQAWWCQSLEMVRYTKHA